MASRLEAVTFEVADAHAVAAFWAALLTREVLVEPGGALVPGDETQVGLRFVTSTTEQLGPRRLHLHVTSRSLPDQERTIETALRLGGRHLDVGQGPDAGFVVLADPGDNELCVIEPGNRFLADTGQLGEVTCEGSRDVGLFWHGVLGWPLVWDQDQETAVQSPLGGTKVSWSGVSWSGVSWSGVSPGGEPLEPKHGRSRQRLDLVTADLDSEAERLVSLGATRVGDLADGVELVDPDGNEFSLRAG